MLRVEGVGHIVIGHQEIHKKCCGHWKWKYFMFYMFFKQRVIGKHCRKDIGGSMGKAFKNLILREWKHQKRHNGC
jgi:hypothetical protein